ncbi:MAG: hypothetical protein KDA84_22945, partial [Planctomycetaceae bacterium]|nr:hypothetical protein [Planctomycetaceae bacterium]
TGYGQLAASPVTDLMAGYVGQNEVTLFDPRDGKQVASLNDPYAEDVSVGDLRFTQSGLVIAACEDDCVRIWEAASGELIASLGAGGQYDPRIATSQDGRWLAVTHSGSTQLYEVRIPTVQQVAGLVAGSIFDVEFSKDHQLKTLTEKRKTGANQLAGTWLETWDLESGQRMSQQPLGLSPKAFGLAFNRPDTDGRIVRSLESTHDGSHTAVLTSLIGPGVLEGSTTSLTLLPHPGASQFTEWQNIDFKTSEGQKLSQLPDDQATDGKAVQRKTGESLSFQIPGNPKNQIVFLSVRVEPQLDAPPTSPVLETWFHHNGKQIKSGTLQRVDLASVSDGSSYFLLSHCHLSVKDAVLGLTAGPAAQTVWIDRVITANDYQSGHTEFRSVHTSPLRTLSLSPDGNSLWALGVTEDLVGWKA